MPLRIPPRNPTRADHAPAAHARCRAPTNPTAKPAHRRHYSTPAGFEQRLKGVHYSAPSVSGFGPPASKGSPRIVSGFSP
jgi:hypothetical protein